MVFRGFLPDEMWLGSAEQFSAQDRTGSVWSMWGPHLAVFVEDMQCQRSNSGLEHYIPWSYLPDPPLTFLTSQHCSEGN